MINLENNGLLRLPFKATSATLRAIRFRSETDLHNEPVTETVRYMHNGRIAPTEGQAFVLTDDSVGKSILLIVPVPDCIIPTLGVNDGYVEITTGGYPVSQDMTTPEDADRLLRAYYRMIYKLKSLCSMSNTWGDRNGRTRVCEDFIIKEIDSAAELGLDAVQIDDGWQKGVPDAFDERGYRMFDGDFWELREELFPRGIRYLTDYAAERGISLGLWFAPDSREGFKNHRRDISVLKKAHSEWGIRYFKLDMLKLESPEDAERAQDLIEELLAFSEDVSVELDVTADRRLGFLASAPYGTIFLENRYTAWSNYYPHATLRNLWRLSKYIPASKLQTELANPALSTEKYSKQNPLRPESYGIDYLFASVMVSNPLFWMEIQHLKEEDKEILKPLISLWKSKRSELTRADVTPIGQEPSGRSFTGFCSFSRGRVNLILLREVTECDTYTFTLPFRIAEVKRLYGNCDSQVLSVAEEGATARITVRIEKERGYLWLSAEAKV